MKSIIVTVSLLLTASAASAQVVFLDNFNEADTTDLSTNAATRQTGGSLTSTYTEAVEAGNLIASNKLSRVGGGKLTTDTNFASSIVGEDYTVSFDLAVVNTTDAWTSISIINATDSGRGTSPISALVRGAATSEDVLMAINSGSGGSVTLNNITQTSLDALFGGSFDVNAEHSYAFDVTSTIAGSGTFDFLIDDVVVLDDLAFSASENTSRQIEWVAIGGSSTWDNLEIAVIPEPGSFALLAGLCGLVSVAVRRRP